MAWHDTICPQGPFNYLDMLPSPPEEVGTVFLLYTRLNQELPQVWPAWLALTKPAIPAP